MPDLVVGIIEATNGALDAARTATVESVPTPPSLDQMTTTLDTLAAESLWASQEAAERVRRSMAAIRRVSDLHGRRG
ncbi:hypothetical protein [Actinokineospora globicatena]|uniref:Uncharacterized protein n=1 Tax=Actinokineospora globicatena TaxID=103729 RepID=A0A9W6QQA0_9PSEU|nr:hypothetical protein [Actinokineospora globicatena]GLW94050.1 hypothetical protein Aglo03_48660 [Actinokineospora globicatena]